MNKIFVFAICAAAAGPVLAQPNYCMQETVVGTYALATQGTMMVSSGGTQIAVPGAGLAIVAIDAEGAISGTSYESMAGQTAKVPAQGTIKVNSDCTATVSWRQGVTGMALIMNEGREMSSLMLAAGTVGKPVVTADWKRISRVPNTVVPDQCSSNAMSGTYAFRGSGIVLMTPRSLATCTRPHRYAGYGIGLRRWNRGGGGRRVHGRSVGAIRHRFGGQPQGESGLHRDF